MKPRGMLSELDSVEYENNCSKYDEIINMFKELGSSRLDRRDVLNNIETMVNNGLVSKLEILIDDIEFYENGGM